MLTYQKTPEGITLKADGFFTGGVIGGGVMACIGAFGIADLLPFEPDYTGADIFGFIFMLVWEALAIYATLYYLGEAGRTLTLTDEGILCRTCFRTQLLTWEEIRDWGLSYCGQTKGRGNTYYLYFATTPQKTKNPCRKRLRGRRIQFFVLEDDYGKVTEWVIPYGATKTQVPPFVGEDRYHFL